MPDDVAANLLAARSQMAFTLGFHIVLACLGVGLPSMVLIANAIGLRLRAPAGFVPGPDARFAALPRLELISNRATAYEVPHMLLAAYMVTGFLLASVYAVGLLRGHTDRYVRLGFAIPFCLAAVAAPLQVAVGDIAVRGIIEDQPAKFAAMELISVAGPNQ